MTKFKLFYDKDKETVWLNEMAKEGWAMTGFLLGFYTFEQCEPGKYCYQIDLGNEIFHVGNEYREFMHEQGIEIVCIWGPWIVLRKNAIEGKFELYTDVDSRIEHYTKIRNMFKVVAIIEIICTIIEVLVATVGRSPAFGIPAAFVVGGFAVVFIKMAFHTEDIINQFKERKGEVITEEKRTISLLLAAGLILNGASACIPYSVSSYLRAIVQCIAIVFMVMGIVDTFRKLKGR